MTMHLTNIRVTPKKQKKKHSSAKAAKASRENAESWKKLLDKWDIKPSPKKKRNQDKLTGYSLDVPEERSTKHIGSVDTRTGDTMKRETNHYSGTDMIGIAVLHKSISTPIFKKEDAVAAAQMRR